jgi:hypothetical protein
VWKRIGSTTLVPLFVAGIVTLAGAAQKAPCASREYVEDRSGVTFQCYSDVADLLRTEQLLGDRLPYLDRCAAQAKPCDEYPVGSMYVMRLTAWFSPPGVDPYASFYWTNAALLLACALVTTYCIQRLGGNPLLFAGAPTLAMYGTMNWDLIPVTLSTLASVAWLRGRDTANGILLGLGAAVKIYPLLLTLPFAMARWANGARRKALWLVSWAAGIWATINLPFAISATDEWWTFFRFNSQRPAEFDSLWRVACEVVCPSTDAINILSLLGTGVIAIVTWRAKIRRSPETPLWHLGFPLLVAFLLTNKIWSPQYGLWLLPWFALVAPYFRPFLAYQATEVFVFLARFSFFPSPTGERGLSYGWLAAALLMRAGALIWCLVGWVRVSQESAHLVRYEEDLRP